MGYRVKKCGLNDQNHDLSSSTNLQWQWEYYRILFSIRQLVIFGIENSFGDWLTFIC